MQPGILDTQSPDLSFGIRLVSAGKGVPKGTLGFSSGTLAYAFARTCLLAGQRYGIIFIPGVFFRINFVFPHLFLLSLLQMHHCGYLVAYAHVGAAVIVEVDEA